AAEQAVDAAVESAPAAQPQPPAEKRDRPPRKPHHEQRQKGDVQAEAAAPPKPAGPVMTINIAKLQAMSMADLNQMAKDMGIENFGTMRKHEVIFHILQKNAERSGILVSEGVLEV